MVETDYKLPPNCSLNLLTTLVIVIKRAISDTSTCEKASPYSMLNVGIREPKTNLIFLCWECTLQMVWFLFEYNINITFHFYTTICLELLVKIRSVILFKTPITLNMWLVSFNSKRKEA